MTSSAKAYHINPTSLKVSLCRAKSGNCPFGRDDLHYTSAEAAQAELDRKLDAFPSNSPKQIVANIERQGIAEPEFTNWLKSQAQWSKNEKSVLALLNESFREYETKDLNATQPLISKISGLHFAKAMLSERELTILVQLKMIQKLWLLRGNK